MGRHKAVTPIAEYYNEAADKKQIQLHTHFQNDPFLCNPTTVNNFIEWVTFFRRNLHRFAIDYLGIKLHLYQIIILYLMGVKHFITIIACRAAAKSFIIALYSCCMCILYPGYMVVVSSAKLVGILIRNDWVIKSGCIGEVRQNRITPRATKSHVVCNA